MLAKNLLIVSLFWLQAGAVRAEKVTILEEALPESTVTSEESALHVTKDGEEHLK